MEGDWERRFVVGIEMDRGEKVELGIGVRTIDVVLWMILLKHYCET